MVFRGGRHPNPFTTYVSASGMESDLEDMVELEPAEIALAINSEQQPASVRGDMGQGPQVHT